MANKRAMMKNNNNFQSSDFVDIHGKPITVVISEQTGDILIPFHELRKTGFNIYRRSQYSKLLIDDKQFTQEFDLYMLDCAKTYILQNKIAFKEQEVLDSINKCKLLLTGNKPESPQLKFLHNHNVAAKSDNDVEISFARSLSPSPKYNPEPPKSCQTSPKPLQETIKPLIPLGKRTSSNQSITNELKREDLTEKDNKGFNNNFTKKFDQRAPSETNGFKNRDNRNNRPNIRKPENNNTNPFKPRHVFPAVKLAKSFHEVIVTCVDVSKDPNKKNSCAWVQDITSADLVSEIFLRANEVESQQRVVFKPEFNKLYLAKFEDCWYRCKITGMSPLRVSLVDYGNSAHVDEVKEMPEDLNGYPNQAVRVTCRDHVFEKDETLKIQPIQQFDDSTYLINVLNNDTPLVPQLPTPHVQPPVSPVQPQAPVQAEFFTLPPYLETVSNGQRVVVIGEVEGKLYLRTKQCCDKQREIDDSITNCAKNAVDSVREGQLVLATKKPENKLQRAVVSDINGSMINVDLLDHCSSEIVPLNSIKHITEELAEMPITYFISPPLKACESNEFDDKCKEYVQNMIQNRTKCQVVMVNNDFDLKLDNAKLLSEIFNEFKPSKVDDGRIMLKDMEVYKPQFGVAEYMCNSFISLDEITLLCSSELNDHSDKLIMEQVDGEPYVPVVGEICLGFYVDSWYRCAIEAISDDSYNVLYIDFGNREVCDLKDIRKLPEHFKELPILGFLCKFVGVPNNDEALVRAKISEMEAYDINVKAFNNGKYEIEVPLE